MPRTWRYSGSGAVMMSELVDGSAWMKPPVVTWPDGVTGDVDCADAVLPPSAPVLAGVVCGCVCALRPVPEVPDDDEPPPLAPGPPKAARSTVASFTASAFFRCTTQRPPPGPRPLVGRSSLAIVARTAASRAGLAARTMSALLRVSATTVVAPWAAVAPGTLTLAPVLSASFC